MTLGEELLLYLGHVYGGAEERDDPARDGHHEHQVVRSARHRKVSVAQFFKNS